MTMTMNGKKATSTETISSFGQTLRAFRKKKGFSQEELADRAKITLRTFIRWENGETQPRIDEIRRLAQALNVTEQELLTGDPKAAEWVLTVKIAEEFREEVIDVSRSVPTVASIITTPQGGYLCLGGDYSLWSNPENFKKLIRDLKKFQATVIQNGRALGGIKDEKGEKR